MKLGEGCVVGAGSLVTKDVAPRTVVFGHPAHRQYSREDYNKKLMNQIKEIHMLIMVIMMVNLFLTME